MVIKNMLKKINSTSLFASILIIINSIYLIEGIKKGPLVKNGEIGVTFFPVIISLLLYIPTIIIFIAGLREKSVLHFQLSKISKPSTVIFLTFIFVIIFKSLGYILSSIIYVFSLMLLFEDEAGFKMKKLLNIIYSVIIVLLIFLLYQRLFGVRLPVGEVF